MYNISVDALAGNEPDIAKARFYLDGNRVDEVAATPGQVVRATLQHPGDATVQIGIALVDAAGNESAQTILPATVPPAPDLQAPAAPLAMHVASITWVP